MLKNFDLRWYPDAALTVVMAAKGYPGDYDARARSIEGLDAAAEVEGVEIFHAGTKADGGRILANGGRVLNVSALGKTVAQAQARAYAAVDRIRWAGRLLPPRHRLAGGGAGSVSTELRSCPILPTSFPASPRTGSTPPPAASSRAPAGRGRRSCCCTAIRRPT